MEIKLLPINEEKDREFKDLLNRQLGMNDIDKFIIFYNKRILSDNNSIVKELAEKLEENYRNVELNRKYISLMSEEETAVLAIESMMNYWRFITSLKSIANQMVAEGYETHTRIIFSQKQGGYPLVFDPNDETELKRHWSNRVLASDFENQIKNNPFLSGIIEDLSNGEEDLVAFRIADVLAIDDSFIKDLRDYIAQASRENN